mgnify:CR=1 FL=1
MKKKIYLLIIILFLNNNCGFTPKYAGYGGVNYDLNINKISGDRELNNFIKSQLRRYEGKEGSELEVIYIDMESKFEKKAIARNTKGNVTRFDLIAQVEVTLTLEDITKKLTINDNFSLGISPDSNQTTDNNIQRVEPGTYVTMKYPRGNMSFGATTGIAKIDYASHLLPLIADPRFSHIPNFEELCPYVYDYANEQLLPLGI